LPCLQQSKQDDLPVRKFHGIVMGPRQLCLIDLPKDRGFVFDHAFVPTIPIGPERKSAGAQGRRRCGRHQGGGRHADLSPKVFSRPQSNRTGLQQTQVASPQGSRAYHSASLASDRSRCYRFQRAGMQELLSPCGLRSNLTGIGSRSAAYIAPPNTLSAPSIRITGVPSISGLPSQSRVRARWQPSPS